MKKYNTIGVILFSRYYLKNLRQKELVKWLSTSVQSVIGRQHDTVKKMFVRAPKVTPPVYLS